MKLFYCVQLLVNKLNKADTRERKYKKCIQNIGEKHLQKICFNLQSQRVYLNIQNDDQVICAINTLTLLSFILCRNFNSDYLSCDCRLRWVPGFFQSSSARLGDETLCAYPRSLRGKLLRGLKEGQLNCGEGRGEMTHE